MTPHTMDDTVHRNEGVASATEARADLHVSMRGVHKVFRSRRQVVEALRSIDLDVGRGEFVSLLGPSGCGKSTLLRVIGGLVEPDGGVVEVAGSSPRPPARPSSTVSCRRRRR